MNAVGSVFLGGETIHTPLIISDFSFLFFSVDVIQKIRINSYIRVKEGGKILFEAKEGHSSF